MKYRNQLTGKTEALLGLEALGVELKTGLKKEEQGTLFEQIAKKKMISGISG